MPGVCGCSGQAPGGKNPPELRGFRGFSHVWLKTQLLAECTLLEDAP